MNADILVVGGGLAGLACAASLGSIGFRVEIVEARDRLGGRAGSFADPVTGQLVDACQHVSMGCCTNLTHFLKCAGVEPFLEVQPRLYFMTPDRRVSVFRADPWPAPMHLGRALASAHYLTAGDKLRIAWGMLALVRSDPTNDVPFLPWLLHNRQNERTINRFWGVVLTSALNETVDRIGLRYARKVFVDGFLRHRRGFEVSVPSVPLGRLYGDEMRAWLNHLGVRLTLNASVRSLTIHDNRLFAVTMRDGSEKTADAVVLAVPFGRATELFPGAGGELEPSPITSVHLWFDRPLTHLPHVVLVGCSGQWVFCRGETVPGEWYAQVVVSASRELRSLGRDAVRDVIVEELRRLFPNAGRVIRSKVVTEHAATFSAVPGVDDRRPSQATTIPNLFLAGDWTKTGWPATMEGAVRSGYLAAEAVARSFGNVIRFLQADL